LQIGNSDLSMTTLVEHRQQNTIKSTALTLLFKIAPWHLQIAYEGEIGRLCTTMTFWGKVDFLIGNMR
jgi:hypothetical protein